MDLFHQNWFSVRMEMLITYRAWFAPDQLHPLTLHFWRFPNSVSFSCDWVTHLTVKLLLYWFFFKIQICLGELPTPWLDSIRFPEFIRSLLSSLDNTEQHPREKKKRGGWGFCLEMRKHRIKSKGLAVRRSGWASGINSYLFLSLSFLIYKKRLVVVMPSALPTSSSVLGSRQLWKGGIFVTSKLGFASMQPRQHLMPPLQLLDSVEGPQ